ncbi:FKBP-type peptidyl-prolyl cis-trans isomerase [bacterium]|nr:FKBP-type peptidyl-prolyl cis-trans isomerase [bacterium]
MRKVLALALIAVVLVGCSGKKDAKTDSEQTHEATHETAVQDQKVEVPADGTMPDLSGITWMDGPEGLQYHSLKDGDGQQPQNGQRVEMSYTVWFTDGKMLDSSRMKNTTYTFTLGNREVIRGWDVGVAQMQQGDRWLLKIPPNLAYGERGRPGVPPNATLIFDLEVVGIQ